MGMTIDEAVTRYKNNAEHERAHGNLQGCLEFRQLVEWLEKLQKINKPSYRSVLTFRNYEDYHDAEQYTKGWNDAMDYIFPEAKKVREIESVKKKLKIFRDTGK